MGDTLDRGKIERLTHGVYAPMALLAGMQLDVFTPLAQGPMTARALARHLKVDGRRLESLLHALTIAQMVKPGPGGTFANTAEADCFLVRGRPEFIGGVHELLSDIWSAALQTAQSVRTGQPQAMHDFSAMDDDALNAFFRGLHGGTIASAKRLLQCGLDFGGHRRLLDVGGGSGGLAITLCRALPELRATVMELPRVAPITRAFLAEAGLERRITVIEGDATQAPPPGTYDLVVMRALLQVLSAEQSAAVLANVARSTVPGGRLAIIGRVLGDDKVTPATTALFNLVFLNVYQAGLARTEGEHRAWLEAAGFEAIQLLETQAADRLMTALRRGTG